MATSSITTEMEAADDVRRRIVAEAVDRPLHEVFPGTLLDRSGRRLLVAQLATMAVLAVLHVVFTWPPAGTYPRAVGNLFDVDYEMNLPTWFASAQLMLLALTLAAIAIVVPRAPRRLQPRWLWACCAVAAAYLSADEVAALHERVGTLLEDFLVLSGSETSLGFLLRFPSYHWIVVYAPIFLPVAVGLAVFVWRELGAARRGALLGIFVYLYAALGLDFIEGRFGNTEHTGIVLTLGSRSLLLDVFLIEEMLEMLGVALIMHAFLRHLATLVARRNAGSVPQD